MFQYSKCELCRGAGWILEIGYVSDPGDHFYLVECPVPDCEYSGRPMASLSVADGSFSQV